MDVKLSVIGILAFALVISLAMNITSSGKSGKLAATIKNQKETISQIESQNLKLQSDLQSANTRIQASEKDQQKLLANITKLENQNDDLENRLDKANDSIDDLSDKLADAKEAAASQPSESVVARDTGGLVASIKSNREDRRQENLELAARIAKNRED